MQEYATTECSETRKECSIERHKEQSKRKETCPEFKNLRNFGIREDNTKIPQKKWMNTVAKKIGEKVRNVQEFTINGQKLYETVKKRKNWSAPGIDGIQNYWWKKLKGTWSSLLRCFNLWIEQPDEIPEWMTLGRTVLLPKTEDLSNEKNYRPITCLNTFYKIFTGMIKNCMKEHAERNDIWDRSQLGTSSAVLRIEDQLIIDDAIMDEVRNQQKNLAVSFYDYQKAYDMVRHDWMIRVYQWIGVPNKIVNVIVKLVEGWNTRLEVVENVNLAICFWCIEIIKLLPIR